MDMRKRTFLKLCGTAAVALMPGIKLFAVKIYDKVLRGVRPRSYPGRVKPLNIAKMRKRGDWLG